MRTEKEINEFIEGLKIFEEVTKETLENLTKETKKHYQGFNTQDIARYTKKFILYNQKLEITKNLIIALEWVLNERSNLSL